MVVIEICLVSMLLGWVGFRLAHWTTAESLATLGKLFVAKELICLRRNGHGTTSRALRSLSLACLLNDARQ
ncbi:uncharacterized protein BCR38DRAFT_439078 [Pseudomassariella vexata]|uniref:Uncharacterized protein n=1 Tax=Pseudomassariella vexata TaxID=1141098 RepID=A0A1Y2DTG7_9PEZI|nr:uncharacterized protein BCR38DRAFT_439078 [Pseudomassariella vexata]ORY62568.1 hypothetical protein BCR38DRAFT_439078 [Pseudomassariella vexata]